MTSQPFQDILNSSCDMVPSLSQLHWKNCSLQVTSSSVHSPLIHSEGKKELNTEFLQRVLGEMILQRWERNKCVLDHNYLFNMNSLRPY